MSKNTVKTKTIYDLDILSELPVLNTAYTFVATDEDLDQTGNGSYLMRTSVEDIHNAMEWRWRPTYEQTFTNVSLANRKLYYPVICQEDARDPRKAGGLLWRVVFLNSKGKSTQTVKVRDASDTIMSVAMVSSEPYMTIDWPHEIQGYLSVINAAADIDVIIRGYVGFSYPDVPPYAYASSDMENYPEWSYYNAKRIGGHAFYYSQITDADFSQVTSIGDYAFQGCSALQSVEFPQALYINKYAFNNCDNLTSVNLPAAEYLGRRVFYSNDKLTSVNLPQVWGIDDGLFEKCSKLARAELPRVWWSVEDAESSDHKCGVRTFYNCEKLSGVALGDYIECFSEQMFYGCKKLEAISCNNSFVRQIGKEAFRNCQSLVDLGSMPNVEEIKQYAFTGCSKLSSASFPGCVRTDAQVFSDCTSLVSVDMRGLEHAGARLFEKCTNLISVNFSSLKSSDSGVFYHCGSLTDIDIHTATGLSSIPYNMFNKCSSLTNLILPPLYDYDTGSYRIKLIDSWAFASCENLANIQSWDGVLSVLSCAFKKSCTGRVGVNYTMYFPDARYFAASAFIDSTVDVIDCPEVSVIGANAFTGSDLRLICFNNSKHKVPTVQTNSFDNIDHVVTVQVPALSVSKFTGNWSTLKNSGKIDIEGV